MAANSQSIEVGVYAQSLEPCSAAIGVTAALENNWQAGLLFYGNSECNYKMYKIKVRKNFGIMVLKTWKLWRLRPALGAAAWEHGDFALGSDDPGSDDRCGPVPNDCNFPKS